MNTTCSTNTDNGEDCAYGGDLNNNNYDDNNSNDDNYNDNNYESDNNSANNLQYSHNGLVNNRRNSDNNNNNNNNDNYSDNEDNDDRSQQQPSRHAKMSKSNSDQNLKTAAQKQQQQLQQQQQRHKGNCCCQTCVNKYKYLAATGQVVGNNSKHSNEKLIEQLYPSPSTLSNTSSTSSPPGLIISSFNSNNESGSANVNSISPTSSSSLTAKRKMLSVDTLAENLAQKRLKQQQMQHPQPIPNIKRESKFNISSLLNNNSKQQTHNASSLNNKAPKKVDGTMIKSEPMFNGNKTNNKSTPLDLTLNSRQTNTKSLNNNTNSKPAVNTNNKTASSKSNENFSLLQQQQQQFNNLKSAYLSPQLLPSFNPASAGMNSNLLNQQAAIAALTASLFPNNSNLLPNPNNLMAIFSNPSLIAAAAVMAASKANQASNHLPTSSPTSSLSSSSSSPSLPIANNRGNHNNSTMSPTSRY